MNAAGDLLKQAGNLEAEEFCIRAFVITSESGIINPKVPLNIRYELAYEALRARLGKSKSVSGATLPEEPDYYDLLGLDENATQEEVEEAYKQKKASLQPETLENKLKAQGLSETEIKERLSKAKNTLYYVENAHTILGNEVKRDHYDEHLRFKRQTEWEKTLDRKQRTAVHKKAGPINHGENWGLLGVTPDPSQLELRTAYLAQVRKNEPDVYLQQIGKTRKELTPEEQKELNTWEERWSNINRAYVEELDEKKLKSERKEKNLRIKQGQNPQEQFNILIETNLTAPQTPTSDNELLKERKFHNTVVQAGSIEFTAEEVAELKSAGLAPATATSEEVSLQATTALQLHSKGVKAGDFSQAVDASKFLTPEQNTSLQYTAFVMEALETTDPKRSNSLAIGNQEPTVSLKQVPATHFTPQPNQLILQSQGDGGLLRPLLDEAVGMVQGKVEKAATGLLKKGGVDVAKNTAKKISVDALKKGGKQLITKLGSKIAIKAGVSLTAAAATGGTSLVVQVVLEVAQKLLSFAKKAFSGLLRFITGRDDLKSQLKELSGVALVASLATGAVVPAVISGGVFLTTLGIGSIIGGIGGVASAVFFVVTSTFLAVSAPIIIGTVVFIILVIFITFIINNSAFVVPYGGIGVPPPGTIVEPGTNPYIRVTKLAESHEPDPERPRSSYLEYANEDLDFTVTYTIEITALESNLTNIGVNYNCYVQSATPDVQCPPRSQWVPPPPGTIISPGAPYIITYTQTYTTPTYEDSLIADTVTVMASVVGASAQTASATASICIGDCPENCPALWPVGCCYITQGPNNPYGSHSGHEAIDIGTNQQNLPVYSTHGGDATIVANDPLGGNYVMISSTCITDTGPVDFYSLYSHLLDFSITSGPVERGQQIGHVDNTGNSSATHLHYEFRGGLLMEYPWIPENIQPQPCCNECGASVPHCTTTVP